MREVQGDGAGALGGEPAGALGGAGADLQDVQALQAPLRAEEAGVGLVESLGSPDEAVVAEEGAVLALVLVGVAVPPATAGPAALGGGGGAAGRLRFRGLVGGGPGRYGLLDDRLPRRTLRTSTGAAPRWSGRARDGPCGLRQRELCRVCGLRPGCAPSRIDPVRLPPYATSCAASLRSSDLAGCARFCCVSPRLYEARAPGFPEVAPLKAVRLLQSETGSVRGSTYDFMSVPEPFPT